MSGTKGESNQQSQKKRKKSMLLIEAAIWQGIESFKSSCTLFVTSFPYTAPNEAITSSFGSFKSGSSNSDVSDMSTFREEGDDGFSVGEGGPEYAIVGPFPSLSDATPREGLDLPPSTILTFLEVGREDGAPWLRQWGLEQPPLVGE